jgi:hypothetical protein
VRARRPAALREPAGEARGQAGIGDGLGERHGDRGNG